MILAIIIILVILIVILVVYNISVYKKIESFNNLNQKIIGLNVVQDFMSTLGEYATVEEKINKINDVLIERYQIKYSTIVEYDGVEYRVKASNVDEKHWEALSNLHSEPLFQDSIQTATPKYVTVEGENERLPYQKMEFGRAKSAMFFPLYIDNVYIGYWIIEGSRPHEFDSIDTTILEVIRNNIVSVLRTVENQRIIENSVRNDEYSSLKTVEYLFGDGKKIIDQYPTSTVCIFKIVNLKETNEKITRETGNLMISKVCSVVKQNLSKEYLFIRYMGPKFAIVFSGIEKEAVAIFLEDVKKQIESIEVEEQTKQEEIQESKNDVPKEEKNIVNPKVNIVISTYYKGTALEVLMKKMETYIDSTDKNDINYL